MTKSLKEIIEDENMHYVGLYTAYGTDDIMKAMVGEIPTKITVDDVKEELIFHFEYGNVIFYHEQDCCENVYIESINGDIDDLVGVPLLVAEERVSSKEEAYGSSTWTFYVFRNIKTSIDIRWVGISNGYYSESVDIRFEKTNGNK